MKNQPITPTTTPIVPAGNDQSPLGTPKTQVPVGLPQNPPVGLDSNPAVPQSTPTPNQKPPIPAASRMPVAPVVPSPNTTPTEVVLPPVVRDEINIDPTTKTEKAINTSPVVQKINKQNADDKKKKETKDEQSNKQNKKTNTVKTTSEKKPKVIDPNLTIESGELGLHDTIAPQNVDVDIDHIKVNDVYYRTLFIAGYPRFVAPGWLEPVVNFNSSLDMSFSIYPVEGKSVLDDLRRKIAEMEAEISTDIGRGRIVDPSTTAKLEDARALQEQLVKGIERYFEFSFYITIPANSVEELNHITRQIESTLGSLLIVSEHARLDQQQGFLSTVPYGQDRLAITRNMDTTSVATTFPFTSAELSSDKGVLYGINSQNESFIIFDRFSLENGNMTIFATSGAGKSITFDTPVLIKDKKGVSGLEKIGVVVEDSIKKNGATQIEKDIDGVHNPEIEVLAFDQNLKAKWSNVTIAARKTALKDIYKITTQSGREVSITKDHCLVCLKNGKVVTTKGSDVKTGNYLPIPRQVHTLNQVNKSNAYLTDSFLLLLGLITSEGHIGKRVAIYNMDKPVLDTITRGAKEINVPISPIYNYPQKTQIRGYYFKSKDYLKKINKIGGGGLSSVKRVPGPIFSLPNEKVSKYLKAYFEGDGTVGAHEISATTKSKGLSSDLLYLLSMFGIIARTSIVRKRATNAPGTRKRTYYQVTISGQDNIQKYIKEIGFISKRKTDKSKKLLRGGNTNVDIVPELQGVFQEIRKELYSSSEIPAPKKFSEIMLGIYKPSRKELLNMVGHIKNRVYEIESLEKDGLSKLRALPTVQQIIDKGKDKNTNTLLWKRLGHSWQTIRAGVMPYTKNALSAANITHGYEVEIDEVGRSLYRCFKFTGESLQKYDPPLWETTLYRNANARYEKILKARDHISDIYNKKVKSLDRIKEKIKWLETLATSDLFWDPIVKIRKVKAKHKYVYDLQVDNSVFLAGHGGMFVHNSYFVKAEAVRSLMIGSEAIILDPEAEYKNLCEAVGGEYISFSFNSPAKINPFDLAQIREEGENQLGLKILSLHSLFKVIMGEITPTQEAMLDRALIMTYKAKGITTDPETQSKEPPLIEDLYKTLIGMEVPDALDLAARIEKFVRGSFAGIFDKQTNIDLDNPFTVFSVKDLEDALRPIAMFMILDYIWTRVKRDIKRRVLIVDEAWHMMRYPDTAQFLWSVVKRARKYYLGLTTITQDVEDFLAQDIGKAIVTNSALRLLLKQSPAAIDKVGEIFYLSQGEKQLLLAANIGEGIFFAGPHHAPIRIVASEMEHNLISTKPQETTQQTVPNVKAWNKQD